MASDFAYRDPMETYWSINIADKFGKTGSSLLAAPYDIDNDGEWEMLVNVGNQAHIAALDQDGSVVWENVISTTKAQLSRWPKVHDGSVYFGNRPNNTIYSLSLSDGSIEWSKDVSATAPPMAMELTDYGIVWGGISPSGAVGVLDFDTGDYLSGWPNGNVKAGGQTIGAGDIDGDGEQEIAAGDQSGNLNVLNKDGSILWSHTSDVAHYDWVTIADIHPTHSGTELLTQTDEDSNSSNEGDELSLFDSSGAIIESTSPGTGSPSFVVGPFRDDYGGQQAVYSLEGDTQIGLLDGTLSEIWSLDLSDYGLSPNALGQTMAGDFDGDGKWEFAFNDGEDQTADILIFDSDGDFVCRVERRGWDFDPIPWRRTGEAARMHAPDINDDGRDELWGTMFAASQSTGEERINLLHRTI